MTDWGKMITTVVAVCALLVGGVVLVANSEVNDDARSDGVIMRGYNGTNHRNVRIDTITRGMLTIPYEHHEIHGGSHYFAQYSIADTDSGVTRAIAFTAPNSTADIHMLMAVNVTGAATVHLYEAESGSTIYSSVGTTLTCFNSHRDSSNTTTLTAGYAPALVEQGVKTTLLTTYVGAAGASPIQAGTGGSQSRENEIILAAGKKYVFQVTSTGDNNVISMGLDFYEHTPLD